MIRREREFLPNSPANQPLFADIGQVLITPPEQIKHALNCISTNCTLL